MAITLGYPGAGRVGPGTSFLFSVSGAPILAGDQFRLVSTDGLVQAVRGMTPGVPEQYMVIGWDAISVRAVGPSGNGLADGGAIAGFHADWFQGGTPLQTLDLPGYLWDPVSGLGALMGLSAAAAAGHDPMLDLILAAVTHTYTNNP